MFSRIEDETLDQRKPEGTGAPVEPYLVPRETSNGVSYVRSRKRNRSMPGSPGAVCIGLLAILSGLGVLASLLLANDAAALNGWQLALGVLYPLQIALDVLAFARFTWPFVKWRLGDLEVELS